MSTISSCTTTRMAMWRAMKCLSGLRRRWKAALGGLETSLRDLAGKSLRLCCRGPLSAAYGCLVRKFAARLRRFNCRTRIHRRAGTCTEGRFWDDVVDRGRGSRVVWGETRWEEWGGRGEGVGWGGGVMR